ncbi:unannotated protein [freshwater metagenome]|uniref:Unannotated protein n=1 Tax=freshwater metagenome TaxID=449393 RepID=A0A6J6P7S2_9ZZZZ
MTDTDTRPLILCADDDDDILALVALRLERAGFAVKRARDGEEALQFARELHPVVAVLDVMMPRRTGIEVVGELRADPATSDIKLILLSARVQQNDVDRGIDAGADAYLPKPFKAADLVEPGEGVGMPIAQLLRSRSRPVIFTSIFPATAEVASLDPSAYLVKPFPLYELETALVDAVAAIPQQMH